VTDGATREALASLEGAAVERLAGEVARAREVLRLAEEMARALHSDHDSDVAALWRARVAPLRDGSARERARRTAAIAGGRKNSSFTNFFLLKINFLLFKNTAFKYIFGLYSNKVNFS
jgi:ATP/maltotriose-dependent transcriptional regulator MalT